MRQFTSLFCVAALLLAQGITGATAPPAVPTSTKDMKVVFSQIAHRHGARTPLVGYNGSILCGKLGCGNLNQGGKAMLQSIGQWARIRYINGSDATTTFMKKDYDTYSPNYISSRSTDLSRTLQSADGFLRGLFPDLEEFYPVISTVSFYDDTLLLVDALSAFHIAASTQSAENWAELLPEIEKLKVFDMDTVHAIGRELSLDQTCIEEYRVSQCLLLAQDVAASFNTTGQLQAGAATVYPVTSKYLSDLMTVRSLWNAMQFPYDPKDQLDQKRGSLGQNLAQEIVSSMKSKIHSTGPAYVFKEWSAHDTTMMPLCATLGANEAIPFMLPLFGESFFFELLQQDDLTDKQKDDESNYFVRGLFGHPEQQPGSHSFHPSVFPLKCTDKAGSTYTLTSEDQSCPLTDWHRFINSSKPEAKQGLCYVEPSLLDDSTVHCPPNNSTAPAAGSPCAFYRQHCPRWACGDSHYLSFGDLRCLPTTEEGVRTGTVTVVTLAAVGAGLVIGAVLALAIGARAKNKKNDAEGYSAVNTADDGRKSV